MDKDEDFNFDGVGDFDAGQIALEELAKIMAGMFKALVKQNLSPQEAAALTAAYFNQVIPTMGQGPSDGS